ncbi:DUF1684 domain-containing protein [Emticicia sp. BO119]|uniref:DUF1684 domain-containing protein n=1 Tax=Emticicia sp. BO119 TaxID=2757768 RepID=UPI0015F007AD|nr:DUF1684 domain-containing protein [Emticicia sp. BO119]MBA4851433.1 DUF1684 domain-containing protein [Emticicia sp. BO119]
MFKNKFVLFFLVIAIAGILFYSLRGTEDYIATISEKRNEYAQNLTNEKDSPIANLSDFTGFKYFEPNVDYRIEAEFKGTSDSGKSLILMTDSTQTEFKKAGEATFLLNGENYTVSLFDEGKIYLLPFRDLTSGKETYGGGRYINIEKDKLVGDKIEIDFNNAHNFYCAYNESYICPIPPKENFIKAEIKVGEKVYK